MLDDLLDQRVSELLEDISHHEGPTAGGSLAALAAAGAAALTTRVARGSRGTWQDAGGAIAQSEALRARLGRLAQLDAAAFAAARNLLQRAGQDRDHHGAAVAPGMERPADSGDLSRDLAAALAAAAEVPVQIAEAAAEVAAVASWAAREGSADHRADAVVAAILANAAVLSAAHLVAINLASRPDDAHAVRAEAARVAAAAACEGLTT